VGTPSRRASAEIKFTMTEYVEGTTEQRQIPGLAIAGGALVILLLLALLLTQGGERPLKPLRPSATPVELSQNSQAILVTFNELNANPYAFRDQRIRVTGDYTPQPKPDCPNYKGLLIRWALINDTLQLNGYGFEEVLKLVPAGTTLTVEGIWRLYDGTAGCGKGAARQLIWYLQVERILQPNPLPGFGPLPDGDTPALIGTPSLDGAVPTLTGEETATLTTLGTSVLAPTMTATPTPKTTPAMTLSPSATLLSGEITPTPTDSLITSTPDPLASPTAAGTNPATTNTPPSLTPGTAVPTVPGLSTSTPGPSPTPGSGYPGPGTAVPTVDPYPSN
jgi:hypothetical protein